MSYPFRVQFDRRGRGGEEVDWVERSGLGGKEWAGWEGVGRGGRSGPGGKRVGRGERRRPGGKEWAGGGKESAGADWVVVRYISQLPRFFIRFFKALSGDRTIPLHGSSSIIYYSETFLQFIPGD